MHKMHLILFLLVVLLETSFASQKNFEPYIIKVKSPAAIARLKQEYPSIIISQKSVFSVFTDGKNRNESLLSADARFNLDNLRNYYNIYLPNSGNGTIFYELKKNPEVILIEKNYIYRIDEITQKPDDEKLGEQWGLDAVNAVGAWAKASGNDVIVGVVDTGIEWDHPDLKNQLWINKKEDLNDNGFFESWSSKETKNGISGDLNGIDDDGNGYEDDVIGYSFVNQFISNLGNSSSFNPYPEDEHSHGTIVSGVIAAQSNNKIGISGLAYDSKIMTLRAFDATGNAQSDNIAAAIVYGALNGARVLNFSFGEEFESTIVHDAVKFAYSMRCVMLASAGNNGWDRHHYPSDYEECLSVGASNKSNGRDWQSNYGSRLALLAPGTQILTTTVGGEYKLAGGTSLSSPFVSAVSAMLIELNPRLKPNEVYGILRLTSKDIDDRGWDYKSGSGVLDAKNAVENIGASSITITEPKPAQAIHRGKQSSFPLIGSVICPLFLNYQVFVGMGDSPFSWTAVGEPIDFQALNDTLANISINGFEDTLYTVKVLVNLRNNSTLEKRVYVQIVSDDSPLKILYSKSTYAYFNEKRAVVISVKSNQLTNMSLKYRPNNSSEDYSEIMDKNYLSYYHTIVLTDEVPVNKIMDAKIVLKRSDGETLIKSFTFSRQIDEMTSGNFTKKYNTLPMLYLFNKTADLYASNSDCFVADDISNGLWRSTKVFEFKNNEFVQRDSLPEAMIPVGYGDSDGDGNKEVFTKVFGSSKLYESDQKGGSPFSKVIFGNDDGRNNTAAGMFDFTGDGKEELITFTDNSFRLYTNENGLFSMLSETDIDTPYNAVGTFPGLIYNFDEDPKMELAYTNNYGHFYLMEYINQSLRLKYFDRINNSFSPQYLSAADIDADGKKEIVSLNYGSRVLFNEDEAGDVMWQIRILKSNGPYDYFTLYTDYIYGVRSGSTRSGVFFQNGMTTGNVDGKPGDEILVSSFPNLYVFKWDNTQKKLVPLWWYPETFSNDILINDFDKNNTNEFGFSTLYGTMFYEYDSGTQAPEIPGGFRAYAINETSAFLKWNKTLSAQEYIVYEIKEENRKLIAYELTRTTSDSITIASLTVNKNYMFALRAFNSSLKDTFSDFTQLAYAYTHKPAEPLKAVYLNRRSIQLSFSGKIPFEPLESKLFTLTNEAKTDTIQLSTINRANDSSVVIVLDKEVGVGTYVIDVKSFRDYYGTATMPGFLSLSFFIDEPEKEIYLTKLTVNTNYQLKLEFSDDYDNETALKVDNYVVKPSGKIQEIRSESPKEIIIDFDKSSLLASLGYTYTITVFDVLDKSKRYPITKGAGNTLGFVFFEDDLSNVFVYPNPIKLFESPEIRFANLTSKATVYIYTLTGVLLRTLDEIDGNGGVEWDGKDSKGRELETGVYLFKVKGINKQNLEIESELQKFSIIR